MCSVEDANCDNCLAELCLVWVRPSSPSWDWELLDGEDDRGEPWSDWEASESCLGKSVLLLPLAVFGCAGVGMGGTLMRSSGFFLRPGQASFSLEPLDAGALRATEGVVTGSVTVGGRGRGGDWARDCARPMTFREEVRGVGKSFALDGEGWR